MWPFRTKHVVHVEVKKNEPTAQRPEPRVATYRFIGDDPGKHRRFYFDPEPFKHSKDLTAHVKGELPPTLSEKQKKRTIVKIWRDDDTRHSSSTEKTVVGALNLALLAEIVLVVAIAVAGALISQERVDQLFPGTALAAIAANAAFFLGNFAVRGSKLGEPFEYTKRQQLFTYGAILGSMLLNLAVLNEFPAALLPPTLIELSDTIQRVLAIAGLIGTVIGAGFSGAFDAFKWILIEEVQRDNVAAREAMDAVKRREEVRA